MNKQSIFSWILFVIIVAGGSLFVYTKYQVETTSVLSPVGISVEDQTQTSFVYDGEFSKLLLNLGATELSEKEYEQYASSAVSIPFKAYNYPYTALKDIENTLLSDPSNRNVSRVDNCLLFQKEDVEQKFCDIIVDGGDKGTETYTLIDSLPDFYIVQEMAYEYTPMFLVHKESLQIINGFYGFSISPDNRFVFAYDVYAPDFLYSIYDTAANQPLKAESGELENWMVENVNWNMEKDLLILKATDMRNFKYALIHL